MWTHSTIASQLSFGPVGKSHGMALSATWGNPFPQTPRGVLPLSSGVLPSPRLAPGLVSEEGGVGGSPPTVAGPLAARSGFPGQPAAGMPDRGRDPRQPTTDPAP